ncbi:DUF2783 domain-containing protein [Cognatishimia sp. WU-CL00825]|uniref:DUF2783 domain-containing protein n=1 Tax=Cognatishimia sp. WU-CL00825 TaxID=3127658 RepID=UPI0031067E95
MGELNTKANIADADQFYEDLINAHAGLSEDESQALNSRLILLLANHVGDMNVLSQALAAARAEP